MKSSDSVFTVFGIGFVVILVSVIFSLFTTFLWFCFDDKLAEILGQPWVGDLAWYHVWPFLIFFVTVFKTTKQAPSKNETK